VTTAPHAQPGPRTLAAVGLAGLLVLVTACRKRSTQPPASTPAPAADAGAAAPIVALGALAWDARPLDWTRPIPSTPPGGLAEAGYVGSAACAPCHAELTTEYARHSMAQSGLRPLASLDQRWLAEIFDAGMKTRVRHEASGYAYRPVRRGTEYFIEELLLGDYGVVLHSWLQPVTHTLSAGGYGLAFYFRHGNRLHHTPLDYFAKARRWGLDPAASGSNPRFQTRLGDQCISCHSDYPLRSAGAGDVFFDPLPTGIGCERCHGPGQRHSSTGAIADIVNPARLSPLRQLDTCTQCHQSSFARQRAGRHDFSFRPGERADDFRVNYLAQPAEPDRLILLSHPERMVQSACYLESAGRLTCTSCHDPHKSSFEQPAKHWDDSCTACHQAPGHTCTGDPAERAAKQDHCIVCHMRPLAAADVPLVEITDHWIQRRPPPLRPGRRDPPRRLVPWSTALGDPTAGDDLAALELSAYADAGREDEALARAAAVVATWPRAPELYEWLVGYFGRTGDRASRTRAQAALLRVAPDGRSALLGYARGQLDQGTPAGHAEALHALDRLLALSPDDAGALETKAMVLFRDGDVEAARPLFERAAAAGPSAAASRVALAVLALKAGQRAPAIRWLEEARRIEPRDDWLLDKLQRLYDEAKDSGRALALAQVRSGLSRSARKPAPTDATRWLPAAWR